MPLHRLGWPEHEPCSGLHHGPPQQPYVSPLKSGRKSFLQLRFEMVWHASKTNTRLSQLHNLLHASSTFSDHQPDVSSSPCLYFPRTWRLLQADSHSEVVDMHSLCWRKIQQDNARYSQLTPEQCIDPPSQILWHQLQPWLQLMLHTLCTVTPLAESIMGRGLQQYLHGPS